MNSKQIIFRNDSKSLSICNRVRIFEGEKNVDCFEFMIPSTYNNIDLTKCDIVLVYITPDGIEHNLLINDYKQSEVYKKFNVYLIDIDERFTSIAGELKLYLKFTSSQNSKDIILETSSATIDLDKVPSGESGITPEKQDAIDQILLRSQEALKTATQALDKANSVVEKANNGEFNGKDGYTPQKGIDYFDGAKGEQGEQGLKGEKGEDGKDYVLTDQDKQEIADLINKGWKLLHTYVANTEEPNSGFTLTDLQSENIREVCVLFDRCIISGTCSVILNFRFNNFMTSANNKEHRIATTTYLNGIFQLLKINDNAYTSNHSVYRASSDVYFNTSPKMGIVDFIDTKRNIYSNVIRQFSIILNNSQTFNSGNIYLFVR